MFDQTHKDNPQKQWQLNEISVPKSAGLGSEWQFVRENLIISAQDLKELLHQQMDEALKFFEKAREPIYSFYTFNFSGSVVIDSLFGKILGAEELSMYYGFFC